MAVEIKERLRVKGHARAVSSGGVSGSGRGECGNGRYRNGEPGTAGRRRGVGVASDGCRCRSVRLNVEMLRLFRCRRGRRGLKELSSSGALEIETSGMMIEGRCLGKKGRASALVDAGAVSGRRNGGAVGKVEVEGGTEADGVSAEWLARMFKHCGGGTVPNTLSNFLADFSRRSRSSVVSTISSFRHEDGPATMVP